MAEWMMFLDDERLPPEQLIYDYVIVRSVEEALQEIIAIGSIPIHISFDHDLGENKKTGYDLAKILVELDMDGQYKFPGGFSFFVHSQNPVGAKNIECLLNNYLETIFGNTEYL